VALVGAASLVSASGLYGGGLGAARRTAQGAALSCIHAWSCGKSNKSCLMVHRRGPCRLAAVKSAPQSGGPGLVSALLKGGQRAASQLNPDKEKRSTS
jgi:hypothetical protein